MTRILKLREVLMFICLLSILESSGQNFAQHNWYFGTNARGIEFSRTDNSPSLATTTPISLVSTGGSAVATDPTNANVLFYTDGSRVFNISNTQMSNGFGLNANTASNQPVALSRIPGQPDQYLIFTNTASFMTGGSVFVSTVNMTLAGGEPFPTPPLGNVTTKNVATGLTGRSEAMITIPHDNGTDFWLITHENGTDNYTSTLIEAGPTFTHNVSPNVTGLPISAANFSYHAGTGKIAVSPQSADDNVIILNFDDLTGAITFDQFVFNSAVSSTISQANYDTEWNNSGRFLYISRHGEAGIPADVVQFDLNNPGTSLATVIPASLTINRSYGLQMAPDSTIYHLYETGGIFRVGALTDVDSVASLVQYTRDAFGPNLNFNGTQFPSFVPRSNLNLSVSFITEGTCSSSPISFYPSVSPAADSLLWRFGDGQSSSEWSPIHTYQNGGSFNVGVVAYLNGDSALFNMNLVLINSPLQLDLVPDTTACRCEFPPPVGTACPPGPFRVVLEVPSGSPSSIIWSNGDTGMTLTPDSAGYYYVVVTDATGCTAYAGVNVREYDAVDQRANVWYFGENAGIDFNTPPGIRPITGPINTLEGVSVISDRNGQVILSTDGVRVYDRNDNEITDVNGVPIVIPPGIGGSQDATQAALIIPVPGDETLFYIFTTQEVHGLNTYELRYSLYDIKLNNGDGGLVQINQLLFTRSTERITGNGNWLIAHEYGNNSFRAYPITPTGIGNPVISSIGSDHVLTDVNNGHGYMKLGGPNMLAVALPSASSNVIEFFDFDNATGEITNFRSVDLNNSTHKVYGIEFAGNKIFATLRGTSTSFIREMYIDFEGNPVLITPSAPSIPAELGAIQLGPDQQLYVAGNNRNFLGTIQVNGDTLQLSGFLLDGFQLAGGTQSTLGLPNFIQNVGTAIQPASMLISGFCEGSPTSFVGTGTDPIDEFSWSFGDGFSADSAIVEHTYPITGVPTTYNVSLRVTNRCGLDTLLMQTITIYPPPASPTFLPPGLPQPVICGPTLTVEAEPAPGTPGYTYLWSTGATTRSIVISQRSNLSVTITNAQGCATSGSILISDNRPQVDLGPDQTICQNTPVAPLDAQNPGAQYQWFVDGVANGNITQTQSVPTTVADPLVEYIVQVLNPITTCVTRDTVTFTINESPAFNAPVTNPLSCGANGQIALEILSPAGSQFTYSIVGLTIPTNNQSGVDVNPGPVLPIFNGPADTYIIDVQDQITGCNTVRSVGISDAALTLVVNPQLPTCNPGFIEVQTNVVSFISASYTVTNTTTGVQVIPATSFTSANFTTLAVPVLGSTDYTVQISAQSCVTTANVTMVPSLTTVVGFDLSDICQGQVTATPLGAASYTWTTNPPGGFTGAGQTVTIDEGTWDVTVIVDVNDGVTCPGTGNVTVTVEPPLTANFTQSDECQNQVTLSATPVGSYTYRWYDGPTLIPGGSSIIVGASEDGDTYRVEVVSSVNGCIDDFSADVSVVGDLQLSLNAINPMPCEGTLFSITATSNNPSATFTWFRNDSVIPGQNSLTLSNLTQGGDYKITASILSCTAESPVGTVIMRQPTPGTLPSRALICPFTENPNPETRQVELEAGVGYDYQWYQNDVAIANNTNTLVAVEEAIYRVEFMSPEGCPSGDQTDVIEDCSPIITAPTAFRPGSSITANTTFYLFTRFVADEDFQFFIYNRWGELIYQANGLTEGGEQSQRWNGGYNNSGPLLPSGTYTYVVKYRSSYRPEDGIQEHRGGVVLLR